jgi:hypothetical protein
LLVEVALQEEVLMIVYHLSVLVMEVMVVEEVLLFQTILDLGIQDHQTVLVLQQVQVSLVLPIQAVAEDTEVKILLVFKELVEQAVQE